MFNKLFLTLTVIGDKVKDTTSNREVVTENKATESAYTPWTHVFDPSTNALKSWEELGFFTFVMIMFFVILFAFLYNLMVLIKILCNLDGSLYQTKHIAKRVLVMVIMVVIEIFILKYIITVAASGAMR